MSFTQHFVNCKVCTWVLLNTLLQFHEFFLTLCIFEVFYNVNTVRSKMWVWVFPNHSCQKFLTNHSSSTRDFTRFLAFVIWKNPNSHFFLTVFSHFFQVDSGKIYLARSVWQTPATPAKQHPNKILHNMQWHNMLLDNYCVIFYKYNNTFHQINFSYPINIPRGLVVY